MGGNVLQGFEPILDKPEDWAPPVCRRVLGDEGTQIVTFMSARFLPLNVGQVYAPMLQDLTGEFPFFGSDEHSALGLSQQTPDLVEGAVWHVACQPIVGSGSDPLTPDLVERVCQRGNQRFALGRCGGHQGTPNPFPMRQHKLSSVACH